VVLDANAARLDGKVVVVTRAGSGIGRGQWSAWPRQRRHRSEVRADAQLPRAEIVAAIGEHMQAAFG
jgi:hypothetical protein